MTVTRIDSTIHKDLFERLVVDKACRIFWNVQLAFLEVFTKLPTIPPITSGVSVYLTAADSMET